MNKNITIRADEKTVRLLENLKKELNISKSDIVRMSISHFKNYIDKVNK